MKMEIKFKATMPKLKFKKGDIVQVENQFNDKSIHVRVEKLVYGGAWTFCAECGLMHGAVEKTVYAVTIQKDSFTDKIEYNPIRPGLAMTYPLETLEDHEKVDFPHEIVEADTPENFQKRQADWRSYLSQYQKEK